MPHSLIPGAARQEAASKLGRTRDDVGAALHAMPFDASLASLLRALERRGAGGKDSSGGSSTGSPDVDVIVLSDANTVRLAPCQLAACHACCHHSPARPSPSSNPSPVPPPPSPACL